MGTLKPGATYIYEREHGRVYAREFGSTERQLVGYEHKQQEDAERRYYMTELNEILKMCETDPAMKELLDQLFVLYNLKRDHNKNSTMWHPV